MNEDMFKELETERLILRKINYEDATMLYNNIFNNFEYYKLHTQLQFNSLKEYQERVEKYQEWYLNGNHFRWGVVEKKTNEMIGMVQLHSNNNLNNNCKIGYIIGYRYNKKGYAIEAVKKVIDFGFNNLNYHRIEAEIVECNTNSKKLAERLGMHLESIKQESYKVENEYYNERVYVLLETKLI